MEETKELTKLEEAKNLIAEAKAEESRAFQTELDALLKKYPNVQLQAVIQLTMK